MNTSKMIWILVVLITTSGLSVLVHGKRQKPRHDEIERVINNTHSVIWKCSNSECHPGSGLTVFCGTSVPISVPIKCVFCVKGVNFSSSHDYSTCQSCRNCGKHENKTGECTPEEDTTKCLGTCHKGFYMDKITGDCHPCSDCCSSIELADKYHEKQCENSGLPIQYQCRMSNMKCHPTKADKDRDDHDQEDDQQGGLIPLEIAAIVIGSTIFIVIIALLFVFWKYYSWPQAKRILKACCCCCCRLLKSKSGNTVNFHISDHFEGDYLESTATMSGSRLLAEQTDVIRSLPSDVTVGTTKTSKRSGFQRQFSVPVETQSNANLKIPRSSSHPGCLNLKELSKLPAQELSDTKLGGLKKFRDQIRKKLTKKGYTPVPTDQPLENDDLPPAANLGKDCFHKQTSSGEFPGNTLQPVVVAHDPGKERLGKPSVKEQCTSTTGLHQSGTTQVVNIPQEFLSRCLSQNFSAIPIQFYRKICLKLDILRKCFWDDYRLLGEKIGLSRDEITWLGQNGNPTELIIQKFDSQKGSSIGKFKAILENMKRNDVETIIEEWIQDEWHKDNSSSVVLPDGKGPDYKFHSLV